MSQCPLCKSDARQAESLTTKGMRHIRCTTCGEFKISDSGASDLLPRYPHYGELSAWARQEHEAGRTAEITQEAIKDPPKIFRHLSVEAKLVLALQTMSRKYPTPGEEFEFDNTDWPLFCGTSVIEFEWIFKALRERVWLKPVSDPLLSTPAESGSLSTEAWKTLDRANSEFQQKDLCFVAMRFVPELDPLFASMETASGKAGYDCERVSTKAHADNINDRMIDMINRCRFVIADFTYESHNVYFEAGYAKGLDKPVIWTKKKGDAVHFDVGQFHFIEWEADKLDEFEERLEISIGAVVGRLAPKIRKTE
jgi:hypothetical protein